MHNIMYLLFLSFLKFIIFSYYKITKNECSVFVAASCPTLTLTNGQISYNTSPVKRRYILNTVAELSCNQGYSKFGTRTRRCTSSMRWNLQQATCESNINSSVFQLFQFSLNHFLDLVILLMNTFTCSNI